MTFLRSASPAGGDHPIVRLAAGLVVLSVVAPVASQEAWQLPERGYALYDREPIAWRIGPMQDVKRGGLLRPVDAASTWRLRTLEKAALADGFQVADFDDGAWPEARLPLATSADPKATWPQSQRVLQGRVRFETPRSTKACVLTVEHEDDVTLWLNGFRIVQVAGDGNRKRTELVFDDGQLDLLDRRGNVLSLEVQNKDGGSYVAVELTASPRPFRAPEQALARVQRDQQEARQLQDGFFTSWRAPAVIHETDLDDAHAFVTRMPVDLRDLGAWLAFDLRRASRGGSVKAEAPLAWKVGDIGIDGKVERVGATGTQRIVAEIEGRLPNERRYEKRYYQTEVMRHVEFSFEGELTVERAFDAERGVVTGFEARLLGQLVRSGGEQAGAAYELEFAERWRLREVRPPRDGKFEEAVVESIRKGAEFLKEKLKEPAGPGMEPGGEDRTYPSGALALGILGLIHAEVPRDDPVLVGALDELRRRKLVDTYSLANAVMVMEAYYAPRGEYEEMRAGRIDRPRPRVLSKADLELVRGWKDQILDHLDTRVDPAYLARWSYVKEARYDHSVNQYGLLGLHSAQLCGLEVSPSLWRGAVAHLVADQQEPERTIKLETTTHRQLAAMRGGAGTTTSSGSRPTGVAGWGYIEPLLNGEPRPIYGSMTCAGLTGLTIGLAGMRNAELTRDPVLAEGEKALRMGLAWLAENYTANYHPGPGLHAHYYSHVFYYLYGVERACELSGIALLNGRDWYQEGAVALLEMQEPNGTWVGPTGGNYRGVVETAMAILFLKKASMPVYTGK